MNAIANITEPVVGLNVPATIGMSLEDVATPALIIDLDAFENNVKLMGDYIKAQGIRHRAHAKTHKSADIALYQIAHGGACGVCCQKVSEAEALVAGGVKDVLVSNQVVDPKKIDRLAMMAKNARVLVCVDDLGNVDDLSAAAVRHGVTIECLVEIDCGAGRCGVTSTQDVVNIAKMIDAAEGLKFAGIQAYQGAMQHLDSYEERQGKTQIAIDMVKDAIAGLKANGLECDIVGGGGTGSYYFESNSDGAFNELQCGSYAFMDADYGRILDKDGKRIDDGEWENAFFLLTQVMSTAKAGQAVVDAGLKAQSVDSGLPVVFGRDDVEYLKCSDEHGVVADPNGALKAGEKLRLVPGHCDPTANLHDWYVGVRGGKVETLWPVSARGKGY